MFWLFFSPKFSNFESHSKKGSILWVKFKKRRFKSLSNFLEGSILRVIINKAFNSLRHIQRKWIQFSASHSKKKGFNSLRRIQRKKGSILCVTFKIRVQFCASFWRNKVISLSHGKKWVQLFWVNLKKSLRHIEKNQFFESCKKIAHMKERFNSLRHFEKNKGFQFFESKRKKTKLHLFESYWKEVHNKRFNSLSHMKKFKYLSHFWKKENKKKQFFESYFSENGLIFSSFSKKKSLFVFLNKSSIFWCCVQKNEFDSLSHILEIRFNFFHIEKRGSFLCVKRRVQFCESFLLQKKIDSLSHTQKEIQFFESYSKRDSILWVIKRSSILWVIILKREVQFCEPCKKRFNSLSHTKRGRFNSFESCSKKSILWVIFKKRFNSMSHKKSFNSMSHLKRFNSLSHISKKEVQPLESNSKKIQFFESYWNTRKVELFESYCKKTSTLLVILRRGSKKAQFFESFTKSSILWVIYLQRRFRFFWVFFFWTQSSILWII